MSADELPALQILGEKFSFGFSRFHIVCVAFGLFERKIIMAFGLRER